MRACSLDLLVVLTWVLGSWNWRSFHFIIECIRRRQWLRVHTTLGQTGILRRIHLKGDISQAWLPHICFSNTWVARAGVWEQKARLSDTGRLCLKKKGDKDGEEEYYSPNRRPCYPDKKCPPRCMQKPIS